MITTGTTSMAIPSPLVSPFTAYSSSDASYHAYFVFHTTSLSVEESYLDIEADAELSDDIYITVLKHNDLEDCYVIDVMCPYYEYQGGESSAVTYHLTGKIYGETLVKHLNIDVTFEQDGCEIFPEPIFAKFVNYNGERLSFSVVRHGEMPVYSGETPTRPSGERYMYSFAGWNPDISEINESTEYTAEFTEIDGWAPITDTVDFDLPSGNLWATHNLGVKPIDLARGISDNPTQEELFEYAQKLVGDYYSWGDTEAKNPSESTCKYVTFDHDTWSIISIDKYNENDGLITLLPEDDAATAKMGEEWKIPTKADWEELFDNTVPVYYTNSGGYNVGAFGIVNGVYLYKSKLITPAYQNITLYGDGEISSGELEGLDWEMMKKLDLESLNGMFRELGGEEYENFDAREHIFSDSACTQLAIYGTDYEFSIRDTDYTTYIFLPYGGFTTVYSEENPYFYLGNYWSSDVIESGNTDYDYGSDHHEYGYTAAHSVYAYGQFMHIQPGFRFFYMPIRPIKITSTNNMDTQ